MELSWNNLEDWNLINEIENTLQSKSESDNINEHEEFEKIYNELIKKYY